MNAIRPLHCSICRVEFQLNEGGLYGKCNQTACLNHLFRSLDKPSENLCLLCRETGSHSSADTLTRLSLWMRGPLNRQ